MSSFHIPPTHAEADIDEAMEMIIRCNKQMAEPDPLRSGVAAIMLTWWEGELARLTNSSGCATSSATH